ncbi:MAG: ribosome small subunit-dependent GTPase A, partial [Pseudomonadota bacterium]
MSTYLVDYGLSDFEREQLAADETEAELARVTEVQRSNLKVVTDCDERRLEWSAKLQQTALVDRPTVGDWVLLNEDRSDIARVLERRSLFKRAAAGRGDEIQPIAANVDTVLIVSSCNEEFKESRLERYLALCREANSEPMVVLTKADLCAEPESYRRRAESVQAGLAVEVVNARDAEQLDGIRGKLAPRSTAALVGSSGVGKSTLLNALAGSELAATQGIREGDKKGRHTTTHRSLYRVPGDLLIIDVPGMRELRVAEADDALLNVFDDIEELA